MAIPVRNQLGFAGCNHQRRFETGAQIQPGSTVGGVGRQVFANAGVEDLQVNRCGRPVF